MSVMRRRTGLTLVEAIVVLAGLTALAGIAASLYVHWANKAREVGCRADLSCVRLAYQAEALNAGYRVDSPEPLLAAAVSACEGTDSAGNSFANRADERCFVVYSVDLSRIVAILCEKHGVDAGADEPEKASPALTRAEAALCALLYDETARAALDAAVQSAWDAGAAVFTLTGADAPDVAQTLQQIGLPELTGDWRLDCEKRLHSYTLVWLGEAQGERAPYVRYTFDYAAGKQTDEPETGVFVFGTAAEGGQVFISDASFGVSWLQ